MYSLMPVPQDFTLEKEKDNREFVKYLIRLVLQRTKLYLKYLKVELLTQKID